MLEREGHIGSVTSSRNSEVIHAGLYYSRGSLKARSCVAGKHMLYSFCAERGVEVKRCGKLIVATDEAQLSLMDGIQKKAEANSVFDLRWALVQLLPSGALNRGDFLPSGLCVGYQVRVRK